MKYPNTALSKLKYFTFGILALVLSLTFAFIAVVYIYEGYYTFVSPPSNAPISTRFDSMLGWELKENVLIDYNGKRFSANAFGMRSENLDSSREHILIIGDSVAYGVYLDDKETISHLLQKKLPQFQAINLGVEGYGIGQTYLRLKKYIEKARPKFIVFIICTENDIINTGANYNQFSAREKPLFQLEKGKLKLFREKLSKYSCLNTVSRFWIFRKTILGNLKNNCHVENYGFTETVKIINALLKKIRALGEEHGSQLILALSPARASFKENFQPQKYYKEEISKAENSDVKNKDVTNNALVYMQNYRTLNLRYKTFKDIAIQSNYDFVDLKNEFEINKRSVNDFFIDNVHYNFEGNRFVVDKIYKYIKEQKAT
jgi:lysophospholipase L1-like esterase